MLSARVQAARQSSAGGSAPAAGIHAPRAARQRATSRPARPALRSSAAADAARHRAAKPRVAANWSDGLPGERRAVLYHGREQGVDAGSHAGRWRLELTPGPGAEQAYGVRVETGRAESSGEQFESDRAGGGHQTRSVRRRWPPLLAMDALRHAVDQGLAQAAEIGARATGWQPFRTPETLLTAAAYAGWIRRQSEARAQPTRPVGGRSGAATALAAQQQTAGRNAQFGHSRTQPPVADRTCSFSAREQRQPVSVKTADGGEVLFDPGSGRWLQPPGARAADSGKRDADRLKSITGHISRRWAWTARPIRSAATGAAYRGFAYRRCAYA